MSIEAMSLLCSIGIAATLVLTGFTLLFISNRLYVKKLEREKMFLKELHEVIDRLVEERDKNGTNP